MVNGHQATDPKQNTKETNDKIQRKLTVVADPFVDVYRGNTTHTWRNELSLTWTKWTKRLWSTFEMRRRRIFHIEMLETRLKKKKKEWVANDFFPSISMSYLFNQITRDHIQYVSQCQVFLGWKIWLCVCSTRISNPQFDLLAVSCLKVSKALFSSSEMRKCWQLYLL